MVLDFDDAFIHDLQLCL